MIERLPPAALDAEFAILSGIFASDRVFFNALETLTPEMFYNSANSKTFAVISKHRTRELIKVAQLYPEFTTNCLNYECTVSGDTEIQIIKDLWLRRKAIEIFHSTISSLWTDKETDAETILNNHMGSILALSENRYTDTQPFKTLIPAEVKHVIEVLDGKPPHFVKTGLTDLDEMVSIQKTDIVVIAGRPSMGKSTLSGKIARHIASSENDAIICFLQESSLENEARRALFTEAGISLNKFNLGFMSKRDLPAITDAATRLQKQNVYLNDITGITPSQIFVKSMQIKQQDEINLKGIFVDYLQLMDSNKPIPDPVERINSILRDLKNVMKTLQCPLFLLSQIHRYDGEKSRPPGIYDLKGSGAIEQDADIIMTLYRPEFYNNKAEEKNVMQLFIGKYKNGRLGEIKLTYLAETMQIMNYTQQFGLTFLEDDADRYKNQIHR